MCVFVCVRDLKEKKSIIFNAFIVTGFGCGLLCKEFRIKKVPVNAHNVEVYVTCVSLPPEPKAGDGRWLRCPRLAMEPTRRVPPSL